MAGVREEGEGEASSGIYLLHCNTVLLLVQRLQPARSPPSLANVASPLLTWPRTASIRARSLEAGTGMSRRSVGRPSHLHGCWCRRSLPAVAVSRSADDSMPSFRALRAYLPCLWCSLCRLQVVAFVALLPTAAQSPKVSAPLPPTLADTAWPVPPAPSEGVAAAADDKRRFVGRPIVMQSNASDAGAAVVRETKSAGC